MCSSQKYSIALHLFIESTIWILLYFFIILPAIIRELLLLLLSCLRALYLSYALGHATEDLAHKLILCIRGCKRSRLPADRARWLQVSEALPWREFSEKKKLVPT